MTFVPAIPPNMSLPLSPTAKVRALPSPPKHGSLAERIELKALHLVQDHRSPEGIEWANRMARDSKVTMWSDAARQWRGETGFVQGWAGTALLAGTMALNVVATQVQKLRHRRDRPYEVDPTIVPVVKRPHDSSYPSGHTSNSFAAARVLSALDPDKTAHYYSQAAQAGYSRVYAGVHFPTDVAAGAALGTGIANAVLKVIPGI